MIRPESSPGNGGLIRRLDEAGSVKSGGNRISFIYPNTARINERLFNQTAVKDVGVRLKRTHTHTTHTHRLMLISLKQGNCRQ